MISTDKGRIGFWLLFIVIAAVYAIFVYLTPINLDDWRFMSTWRDDCAMEGFSFDGWAQYYGIIRSYDNGRIANAVAPFFLMLSPWKQLFPLLTGLAMATSLLLMQRLATGRDSAGGLVAIWILAIVGLPWKDSLFVCNYSLNYIWGSVISLAFIYFLLRMEKEHRRGSGFFWLLLYAIPAAGWHEGFSVAILCGIGLLVLVRSFRFSPQFYSVVIIYGASTLIFMLSPGIINRISLTVDSTHYYQPLYFYGIIFLLLLLTAGALVIPRGKTAVKRSFGSDTGIIFTGCVVAGYVIALATVNTPRAFFWPNLAAIILTVSLLYECRLRVKRRTATVATLFISALCIAQSVGVMVWQYRYRQETDEIISRLEKSESGTVFYDFSLPATAPAYTLRIPFSHFRHPGYDYDAMLSYSLTPLIGVVPEALREADPAVGIPVTGEGFRGTLFNGHLISEKGDRVIKHPHNKPEIVELQISSPASIPSGYYKMTPFVTKGDTLIYYQYQ